MAEETHIPDSVINGLIRVLNTSELVVSLDTEARLRKMRLGDPLRPELAKPGPEAQADQQRQAAVFRAIEERYPGATQVATDRAIKATKIV